jgi:tetratricopeptide (TPR) repeat protein
VVELCESAIEKGLDGTNKQFAKNLLTGTLMQRANYLAKQADPRMRQRGWQQQRLNAMADLEKALKNDPNLVQAYLLLAQLQAMPIDRNHPGDIAAAVKSAQQAFDAAKDQPEEQVAALFIQAKLVEDNDKKLEYYGHALKLAPANQQVLAERGITLLAAGKSEEALTDLTAAVKADPENPQVQLARALALSILNRNDEALEAIDRAIKLAPDEPMPYMHRARILAQQKKYDEALTALGRILEIDPDNVAALLFRAQVYQKSGNLDAAKADVNEALRHQPGLIEAIELHGIFAAGSREYRVAIDDFEKLLKVAPKNPQLLTQLGLLYGLDKRPRKAIEMYTEALAVDPENYLALRGRADAYLNIGKHAEAIPDYEAALKIQPKDSSLLNNLAWVLATSPDDNVRNAKRSIEFGELAAKETDYKQAHILSTLAAGYAESGDFAKAREWSQKAVDLGSEDKETAEQLKKELASYQAEKPWRERQTQEENDGSQPSAKDSSTTQTPPTTPEGDSAAAKDAPTRKQ